MVSRSNFHIQANNVLQPVLLKSLATFSLQATNLLCD